MVGIRGRQLIDVAGYAIAVVLSVSVFSLLIMAVTGTDLFIAEFIMFLAGWAIIAYSLFLLNPEAPWTVDQTEEGRLRVTKTTNEPDAPRGETWFQRGVQRFPPMVWYPLSPDDRISPGLKLFISGVLTLVVSFIFERTVVV